MVPGTRCECELMHQCGRHTQTHRYRSTQIHHSYWGFALRIACTTWIPFMSGRMTTISQSFPSNSVAGALTSLIYYRFCSSNSTLIYCHLKRYEFLPVSLYRPIHTFNQNKTRFNQGHTQFNIEGGSKI